MALSLRLRLLPDYLAVCRVAADEPAPSWLPPTGFRAVSWTDEETSIVCAEEAVPDGVLAERGWRALMIVGPLDLRIIGLLASLATTLAEADVALFAISTFDTDYLLVRWTDLDAAVTALRIAGHAVG